MAQNEQISNRSKNLSNKQKKVPQRGLGVAQLAKIRIDEQRKKEALQAANLFAQNAIQTPNFRPKFERLNQNSAQNTKQLLNSGRGEIVVNWPNRLWNGDLNGRQVNLPYESNNSSVSPQRLHLFQTPSSMSGISPSSIEPPSNQSFRCNSHTSSSQKKNKIVGTKRSYPFSLESPRGDSFNFSRSRSDELANTEPRNTYIRHGTSNSSPLPERDPIEVIKDDEELNGDLLKLGPPVASSPPLIAKDKQSSSFSSQGFWWGPCRSREQQGFSFFPDKLEADRAVIARVSNGNGEKAETIDLNLKL